MLRATDVDTLIVTVSGRRTRTLQWRYRQLITDEDDDTSTGSPEVTVSSGVVPLATMPVMTTKIDGQGNGAGRIRDRDLHDQCHESFDQQHPTTATLNSLSLTAGGDDLITGFTPNNDTDDNPDDYVHDTLHSVRVSAATTSVVVNATTSHTGATVKTSSGTQTGDGVNDRFTLKAAGMDTDIMVEVTAEDKATTAYLYDHCHKSLKYRLQGHHAA